MQAGLKILVVDDNPTILKLICKTLEKAGVLVDVVKLPSPLYVAVMLCGPTDSPLKLGSVATPLLRVTKLPIWLPPSKKVTVPVGLPAPGEAAATVAVKETG